MHVFPSTLPCNLEGIQAGGCRLILLAVSQLRPRPYLCCFLLVAAPFACEQTPGTFSLHSCIAEPPVEAPTGGRVSHPADRGCALARGGFSWTAVSSSPGREREREKANQIMRYIWYHTIDIHVFTHLLIARYMYIFAEVLRARVCR